MPEYGVELPLWLCNWWDLNLDPALLDDLADWQATFNANFNNHRGWDEPAVREEWARQADALIARLRHALPSGIKLEVDLWPLDDRP